MRPPQPSVRTDTLQSSNSAPEWDSTLQRDKWYPWDVEEILIVPFVMFCCPSQPADQILSSAVRNAFRQELFSNDRITQALQLLIAHSESIKAIRNDLDDYIDDLDVKVVPALDRAVKVSQRVETDLLPTLDRVARAIAPIDDLTTSGVQMLRYPYCRGLTPPSPVAPCHVMPPDRTFDQKLHGIVDATGFPVYRLKTQLRMGNDTVVKKAKKKTKKKAEKKAKKKAKKTRQGRIELATAHPKQANLLLDPQEIIAPDGQGPSTSCSHAWSQCPLSRPLRSQSSRTLYEETLARRASWQSVTVCGK
ncbi:hypothetical protein CCMA1212_008906 [Trichoderma ghanense]|uniref:Uncharacterized protein n=1 Tax=Trichoderma ghanense TaxID=65468 RepID=A0ABY2GTH5_9HYPO